MEAGKRLYLFLRKRGRNKGVAWYELQSDMHEYLRLCVQAVQAEARRAAPPLPRRCNVFPAINLVSCAVQRQCRNGVNPADINSLGDAHSPPKHIPFSASPQKGSFVLFSLPNFHRRNSMNVESSSRVWAQPIVQNPTLNHESQPNLSQHPHHPHPDDNLVYPPPPQLEDQQSTPSFNMNRQQAYDLNNAPLSYPPPPPPSQPAGATRSHSNSSYGQAPQGAPYPPPAASASASASAAPSRRRDGRASPKPESYYAPNAAELYNHAQMISHSPSPGPEGSGSSQGGAGRDHYPSSVPRLPPILQVEKQQVTTSATQAASASRRRNEAHFVCPVPGCGSTFTRRFNLRGSSKFLTDVCMFALIDETGHLRSHTEERPYVCDWPGCKKGFARQHDCKCVLF